MEKTYYSRVVGSSFHDRKGIMHTFVGGKLVTSDPELQAELDPLIASGNNPLLYSPVNAGDIPAVKEEVQALAEIMHKAEKDVVLNATTGGALSGLKSTDAAAINIATSVSGI